jgi:hypothetical protein
MSKAKQKSKSCNRGYPCGGSCISRGYNCRKKLTGQGNNYANWLKSQGDRLGDDFNKEAGKRLAAEINSISKPKSLEGVMDKADSDMDNLVDRSIQIVLESDKKMLALHQESLALNRKNVKKYEKALKKETTQEGKRFYQDILTTLKSEVLKAEQSMKELEKNIAKGEAQVLKAANSKPRNQIQKFTKMSDLNKELAKLKDKDKRKGLSEELKKLDKLMSELNDIENKYTLGNQIVPFKKRRGGASDFAEDVKQMRIDKYLEVRSQFAQTVEVIQEMLHYAPS